jgi:uncharacterized Ntn-hydrolase superfamily protein
MLGVAVSSASLACGAGVPHVRALIGAIASQAHSNPFFGIDGVRLLAEGVTPQQLVGRLLDGDPGRQLRQLLIVDGRGQTAGFTGSECLSWAGHRSGEGYVVGGNRLAGEVVLSAMANAFELAAESELPARLLRALEAGQLAGGDRAGKRSAGLLVFFDEDYRYYDLRVDDHADPVVELGRIFDLKRADRCAAGDWRPTREQPLEPGLLERWPAIKAGSEHLVPTEVPR